MRFNLMLPIFRKDLRDAIRDARVLVAVIVPLGLGILYGQIFSDEAPTLEVDIAYTAAGQTQLLDTLQTAAGPAVKLNFSAYDDEAAVREHVADEDADLGLVIPAGFDEAVAEGSSPPLTVIRAQTSSDADLITAILDGALRTMAGQQPPATIQQEIIDEPPSAAQAIVEELGLRRYFVVAVAVMLVAMIGMLAVPVILAEEAEKKTLDALVMAVSYSDVIVAKALVGLVYVVISVGLLLGLTGVAPEQPALFIGALLTLSLALIGFGLLLGGVFKNANQLNTWSGFILLPVIAPAFIAGLPMPDVVEVLLKLLPTSQAVQLMINGLSGRAYYSDTWLGFVVILAWTALAYLLLLRTLQRREA